VDFIQSPTLNKELVVSQNETRLLSTFQHRSRVLFHYKPVSVLAK